MTRRTEATAIFTSLLTRALVTASFLIATRREIQVDTRGHREAECRADALQIDLLYVENVFMTVRGITQKIRSVGVLGGLVQVEVLLDEHGHLGPDLRDLVVGELVLLQGDSGGAEVLEEGQLLGQQEKQRAALGVGATGSTAHAVDVLLGVVGGIVLHDPVHRGDVQSSRGHVRAQQDARSLLAELEKGCGALLLLLLAVDVHHLNVNVVQQLGVEFHRIARRKEDLNKQKTKYGFKQVSRQR